MSKLVLWVFVQSLVILETSGGGEASAMVEDSRHLGLCNVTVKGETSPEQPLWDSIRTCSVPRAAC